MKGRFSVFERSIQLQSPAAEVYAFHENPSNIRLISPQSLKVEVVECNPTAVVGGEFRIRVRQFGIPLDWVGFWEEVIPNEKLVDGSRKCPFAYWRHHHLFREEGADTVMTDRVGYALPFGIIGRMLDLTVMRLIFSFMFRGRHKATESYFARTP